MIRVRPLCLLPLVCALISTVSAAQVPQQQPAQALAETVEVRLLEADAVVLDADGKPVHGLTKEDFVVLEDGTPQPITNFTEYRDTASTSLPGSQSPAPPSVSRPAPRTLAFLLDAMSLRGRARTDFFAEIRALVGRTVRYDDRVLILTWAEGTFRPALDRTSDRRAINAAIDQVEKNPAVIAAAGPSVTTREAELRAVAEAS
ncbi:MAG: VWA domain-containing protein, partial [Thermoanaerobaculia bacterium]